MPGGIANAVPVLFTRCLARLMRCAMVASGTKNAWAISVGRQTAHRAQRQRELRGRRERGIATQEQEQQRVVLVGGVVDVGRGDDRRVRRRERGVGVFASTPRLVAAQLVGQPARRRR